MLKKSLTLFAILTFLPAALFSCKSAPPGVGLSEADFDRNVSPSVDFYKFTNGGWLKNNPVPAEESSWNVFHEIEKRNKKLLREIVESAAADGGSDPGSVRRKIGDFWASGMDEARANADGAKPLQKDFERIAAISNLEQLQSEFTKNHRHFNFAPFSFLGEQDFKNSHRVIGMLFQSGLGLPDRDYYTRMDEKSKMQRTEYHSHVKRMFQLLGDSEANATKNANTILRIETELAEASMKNVEMRDPSAIYNLMKVAELQSLAPRWNWNRYFSELGAPRLEEVNVGQPKFLRRINEMLESVPLEDWKQYLRWHVVQSAAPSLSDEFVNESFAFNGKILNGAQELRPRWKRVMSALEESMGEGLGQEYVKLAFTPEAKRRALEMVHNLIAAFRERIKTRAWMSDATKTAALEKLNTIVPKIGYPEVWRDYSKLTIRREASYFVNRRSASEFEFRRNLDKIGKPVNRTEFGMAPQEVNAYYNPLLNEIAFPAGILQAPFFDERQDDALNYGAMGAVIGHELTHGFDDQGSKFDAQGNLKEWWQPQDREEFERRSEIVKKQFNEFKATDDLNVNGELTLGENIADLGGLTIAYYAFRRSLEGKPDPAPLDGFTADQRFFVSWARAWRGNNRDEYLRTLIQTDPHSPPNFRGIGPLQNMAEFAKAFGCKDGDPMVRPADKRAEIW
ncbi:MAG: M13 family metallopeptidase [Planctomycetota bacterium]